MFQTVIRCASLVALFLVVADHSRPLDPGTAQPPLGGASKRQDTYTSLRDAVSAAQYRVVPAPDTGGTPSKTQTYTAFNALQAYHVTFTSEQVVIASNVPPAREADETGKWQLGVSLESYGRRDTAREIGPGVMEMTDSGLSIIRPGVTEWYVNQSSGLEQGFTFADRPESESKDEPLRVQIAFGGDLRPQVTADGMAVMLLKDETPRLSYAGLVSVDSTGSRLPSHFEVEGERVSIVVADAGAVYPLTIDPTFTQQAYLKAAVTDSNDTFGMSVAISGDTAVVGAIWEDGVIGNPNVNSSSFFDSGATYVFVRNAGMWTQQAYLKASNLGVSDMFGSSVAISGDTIVVGAIGEDGGNGVETDNSAANAGAAYVFVRSGGVWTQQAYLKASNAGAGDEFGSAVAISGDTIVVAAMKEDSNATTVNGDGSNNSASTSGAAYVFARNAGGWNQEAYLKASNAEAADQFGYSVAVSGETVVVGANQESSSATGVNGNQASNSRTWAGAAYVYVRSGGVWSQEAYLKASDTLNNDEFGAAVAISGDTLAVGAQYEDSAATGVNGVQNNVDVADAGAVYVFVRSGSSWAQEAYVKASNTGINDHFGMTLAMSGATMVVGAFEDSNAVGVDGDQSNNLAGNSGAAYVFSRNAGVWSQQAYLKASNTHLGDQFGWSIGISGDTVIVGANSEDSNAIGVNGTQTDVTSKYNSGAAYVYVVTNHPPVANAGPDQTLEATSPSGALATLDGSASTDLDGDTLSFAWVDAASQPVGTTPMVDLTVPAGSHTFTLTVNDGQGGTSSETVVIAVQDTTGASISIVSPTSTTYPLNASVAASFSCNDLSSGVASCIGTVPSGSAIDTTTAGAHDFTVTGTDTLGNASSMTVTYTVSAGSQTITFGALSDKTLGSQPFTVSATGGGSGNPIVFTTTATPSVCASSGSNGSTITLLAVGMCTVRASQAGNANYDPADDVDRSFAVQEGANFAGLFTPWAPPGAGLYNGMTFTSGTVYKVNSTLPVKWGYSVDGTLIDSSRSTSAEFPLVSIYGPLADCGAIDGTGSDAVVSFVGPGSTTTTYDSTTKTWQRNVKLDSAFQGDSCYVIQVHDPVTNTTSPPFPFKTKK